MMIDMTDRIGGDMDLSGGTLLSLCEEFRKNNRIDPQKFEQYGVKRGLRNADGSGVMAGLTQICNVHGYVINEGEKSPVPGRLIYRGIDINDLVAGLRGRRPFWFRRNGLAAVVWRTPHSGTTQRVWQSAFLLPGSSGVFCGGYDHQGAVPKYHEQNGAFGDGSVFL